MKINVIYEDKDLLVVDKPAGLPAEAVPEALRAGVVSLIHRLDKETSGVLLIAKNEESLEFYQKQFADKSKGLEKNLKKRYIALIAGDFKDNEKTIETLIGRGVNDRKKQKVYSEIDPGSKVGKRNAITNLKVVKRYLGRGRASTHYTLLEVFPVTGRKHQIRVHLAYLNHPIVGDKTYGFKDQDSLGLSRHFLHASSIKIKMISGEEKEFHSDLPKELELCLKQLK